MNIETRRQSQKDIEARNLCGCNFHHIGMVPLQVCSDLKWGIRVTPKGPCRSCHYCSTSSQTFAFNTQHPYIFKTTRMHIKFVPIWPCKVPVLICDKVLFHGSSLGPAHDVVEQQKLQKSPPDKYFPWKSIFSGSGILRLRRIVSQLSRKRGNRLAKLPNPMSQHCRGASQV